MFLSMNDGVIRTDRILFFILLGTTVLFFFVVLAIAFCVFMVRKKHERPNKSMLGEGLINPEEEQSGSFR
jgi:hypothetical protein